MSVQLQRGQCWGKASEQHLRVAAGLPEAQQGLQQRGLLPEIQAPVRLCLAGVAVGLHHGEHAAVQHRTGMSVALLQQDLGSGSKLAGYLLALQ